MDIKNYFRNKNQDRKKAHSKIILSESKFELQNKNKTVNWLQRHAPGYNADPQRADNIPEIILDVLHIFDDFW